MGLRAAAKTAHLRAHRRAITRRRSGIMACAHLEVGQYARTTLRVLFVRLHCQYCCQYRRRGLMAVDFRARLALHVTRYSSLEATI